MFVFFYLAGLHARVNSSNLLGSNLGGNVSVGDDTKMTAETCPGVPPSTATPDAVEMVKLGAGQCQAQHQPQQPQHNCADDMLHPQYSYDAKYAEMEAWLDEHPDFTYDYFIRYPITNSIFHCASSNLSMRAGTLSQVLGALTILICMRWL